MELLTVSKFCKVGELLADFTASKAVLYTIKQLGKYGVTAYYWSDDTVTFECLYKHTIKVPVKASKDLQGWQDWTISRANYFRANDYKRAGVDVNKVVVVAE